MNYRKYIDPEALKEFSENIAFYGVISPVTLRPAASGGYELVVGERRLKGSILAGRLTIPAVIRDLSDELVNEIQLSENVHRENPHPFHEAQAYMRMQKSGNTIEEIAVRMGKSKTFVYNRIKLSDLIDPWQIIFLADKINIKEAFEVATLSPQSQYDFYESYATEWQDEDFEFPGSYAVNRFRYDLTNAPFDIKDEKLIEAKGACTNCPLNMASQQTLFPELANKAICSGAGCYHNKCRVHYERQIKEAIDKIHPQTIVFDNSRFLEEVAPILDRHETLKDLQRYAKWEVWELEAPVAPDKADYIQTEEETEYFDEQGHALALDEYTQELEEYQETITNGQALSGILITPAGTRFILFTLRHQRQAADIQLASLTAKAVRQAIKEGTTTIDMLEAEINRINAREIRETHQQFTEYFGKLEHNSGLTSADAVAMRLIVFQSLDYHVRVRSNIAFPWKATAWKKDIFLKP